MTRSDVRFSEFAVAAIVVHTVTYFAVGVLAYLLLDYAELYAQPALAGLMRPTDDAMVMAGPLFQPVRGFVFALVLYPVRDAVLRRPRGWLVLWGLYKLFLSSPEAVLRDLYGQPETEETLYADNCCHLNVLGYRRMASRISSGPEES